MTITILALIVLIFLLIVSAIDFKVKAIPSFFLTSFLLLVSLVNFVEITSGLYHLAFGIIAFIFAWTLYEIDFIGGMADIKIISLIGMMTFHLGYFFLFMIFTVFFGLIYKAVFRYGLKRKHKEEIPFLPCLTVVYIALLLVGGIV